MILGSAFGRLRSLFSFLKSKESRSPTQRVMSFVKEEEFSPLIVNPMQNASAPPQYAGNPAYANVVEPLHICSGVEYNDRIHYADAVQDSDSEDEGDPMIEAREQQRLQEIALKSASAAGELMSNEDTHYMYAAQQEANIYSTLTAQQMEANNLRDHSKFKLKIKSSVANAVTDENPKEIAYLKDQEDKISSAGNFLHGSGGGYKINEDCKSEYDFQGSSTDYGSSGYQCSEYKSIYD